MQTVFAFLDEVRQRPAMFLRGRGLQDLESMLFGYSSALRSHGIDEGVPSVNHFIDFLRLRTPWSLSTGWAAAIDEHASAKRPPLDIFFKFVDEYRTLRPVMVGRVTLQARHQPTGKRVVIGFGGRMERPDVVEVFQYQPEPLFYLKLHYGPHHVNGHILFDETVATSLAFAKRWMKDELSVRSGDWEPMGRRTSATARSSLAGLAGPAKGIRRRATNRPGTP